MILYRIENKISLLGPFTHIGNIEYNLYGCDCPCPDLISFTHDHKFAVRQLELLFKYFGPAIMALHKCNFHITKISIDEQFVVEGNGQCAYLWLHGNVIETYSIPEAKKFLLVLDSMDSVY